MIQDQEGREHQQMKEVGSFWQMLLKKIPSSFCIELEVYLYTNVSSFVTVNGIDELTSREIITAIKILCEYLLVN